MIHLITWLFVLFSAGVTASAESITIANDVWLGPADESRRRGFTFGQFIGSTRDSDSDVLDLFPFNPYTLFAADLGQELSQENLNDFPLLRRLENGESTYAGFGTAATGRFGYYETIGWMHLSRDDEGTLHLLENATNWGSFLPGTERRGPADGIVVGMVPEPSTFQLLAVAAITLALRKRR